MKKVAINGLGRIGRMVLRYYMIEKPSHIEIVAANDLTPTDELAYLIRYDSVHSKAEFQIEAGPDFIQLGSHKITILGEKNPENLPWNEYGYGYAKRLLELTDYISR